MKNAKFGVGIRTNSYAGNFEREMCAHITGCIGECEVGKEYVVDEITDIFQNMIDNQPDDNGCYRPVALGSDIGSGEYGIHDVIIFFSEKPTLKHIDIIKERLHTFIYANEDIEINSVELIEFISDVKIINVFI